MEPANIDWKNIKSRFVEDDLYEHINAPKWIDLSAPEEFVDDEAWFCKPDCRHPKTVEDFLRSTPPPKVKLLRSASVSENLPLRHRNPRDASLKRAEVTLSSISSTNAKKSNKSTTFKPLDNFQEDQENENPNLSAHPKQHSKIMKSSTEKNKAFDKSPSEDRRPQLKSTLSMSNLFSRPEILNQITEFCHELKKLVTRTKENENSKKFNAKKSPIIAKKRISVEFSDSNKGEKDKKPLLEVETENSEALEKNNGKEKQRRKIRIDNSENIQISVESKIIGRGGEKSLLQVRTCPPSPQCFSAPREPLRPAKTTTLLKPSNSTLKEERSVLQEVEQNNSADKVKNNNISIAGKEPRSLDMFWLLKPCTF